MLLDASALLAVLQNEPGASKVISKPGPFAISSINLSEVITKLIQFGVPESKAISTLKNFDIEVLEVNEEIALRAGILTSYGLSLSDRICLATGITYSRPVLTADKIWLKVKHEGLKIILIR